MTPNEDFSLFSSVYRLLPDFSPEIWVGVSASAISIVAAYISFRALSVARETGFNALLTSFIDLSEKLVGNVHSSSTSIEYFIHATNLLEVWATYLNSRYIIFGLICKPHTYVSSMIQREFEDVYVIVERHELWSERDNYRTHPENFQQTEILARRLEKRLKAVRAVSRRIEQRLETEKAATEEAATPSLGNYPPPCQRV